MQKGFINEITVSILFIVLLAFFLDPLMVLMPPSALYPLMAGAVVLFVLFAGLVWRERPLDERDELHRALAGRIGYLLGTVALLIGVLVQSVSGHVDPWLVIGLGAMVVGKLLGHFYSRLHR